MTCPWIVLGGGGHGSVVIDTLLSLHHEIVGYTDPSGDRGRVLDVPFLGNDEAVDRFDPRQVFLANGLGSAGSTARRAALYRRFAALGYVFPPVVHPSAVVAFSATLGPGAQVMAGSVVQPNCRLEENVLVNTRASIDHDCVVGRDVHVAPGSTVCGGVSIGAGAHIGTGASIVQGRCVGANSIIGAGALVLHDVPTGATVVGVPARQTNP